MYALVCIFVIVSSLMILNVHSNENVFCNWDNDNLILDCAGNDLKKFFEKRSIEDLMSEQQRKSVENYNFSVNLSNCNLKHLNWNIFGQYNITWLNLSGNPELILDTNDLYDIFGNAYPNASPIHKSLKYLDLSNSNQNEIPSQFPNLKKLIFENNRINELTPNDFWNLRLITEMKLSGNKIKRIHPHSFANLKYLEYLDISNNDFQSIYEYIIIENENLKVLKIDNSKLQRFSIIYSNSLRKLSLANGEIKQIDNNAFDGLLKVETINLSANNGLHKLSNGLKSETLKEFDLNSCKLDEISVAAFDDLPNLTILDVSNNRLTGLDKALFRNNHKLMELRVDNNDWMCDPENENFIQFRDYVTKNNLTQNSIICHDTKYFGKDWKTVNASGKIDTSVFIIFINLIYYFVI